MLSQPYPERIQKYDENTYPWHAVNVINYLMRTRDYFSYRDFEKIVIGFDLIPEYMRLDLYEKHKEEFANVGYIQQAGSDVWQRIPEPRI
jgi:hypothetical protein